MKRKIEPQVLAAIRSYRPKKAVVFGSWAQGTADQTSDIDLVMVKETDRPFLERLKEFALLVPNGLPRVDAFIYTPEEFELMRARENPLIVKALSEGEVVYEAS